MRWSSTCSGVRRRGRGCASRPSWIPTRMRRGSRSPTRNWKRCASSQTSSMASGTTRYSRPRSNTPKWKTYFGTAPKHLGKRPRRRGTRPRRHQLLLGLGHEDPVTGQEPAQHRVAGRRRQRLETGLLCGGQRPGGTGLAGRREGRWAPVERWAGRRCWDRTGGVRRGDKGRGARIGTRPYHDTPLNKPPELTTEEVEGTDPTHPLCGRRFPILSDTRIADYSDTQIAPPQLSGPAGAGARETDPATLGSARLHRGDTAAPPRRDARSHGRSTSTPHLRRKPRHL